MLNYWFILCITIWTPSLEMGTIITTSAAIWWLGWSVLQIVEHLLFTHITVADQEELQQVIVLFLLRTTVGVKRHANIGESRTRQVVIGGGGGRFSRTGSRILRSGRRAREGGQTGDNKNWIEHTPPHAAYRFLADRRYEHDWLKCRISHRTIQETHRTRRYVVSCQ